MIYNNFMLNKASFSKKIAIILVLLSILPLSVFAKETITIPSKVLEKVANTKETNSSWYLRKVSGTKAGKVLYGPFENKEQAILIWLYLKTPANKSTCISRSQVFITKNPEVFYKRETNEIKNNITEYGIDLVFDHYFFDVPFINKELEVLENETENPITEETINDENLDTSDEAIATENQNEKSDDAINLSESDVQEITLESEENTEVEPEPNAPTVEIEDELPEIIAEEKNPEIKNENEIDFLSLLEEIQTSEKSSRYDKEYLQDYAPKMTVAVPQEEEDEEEIVIIENPDLADAKGITLLMKACENGNDWEIKNLLKAGADVNKKDNEGWTALMYAIRYQQNIAIINMLIQNGAKIKEENIYGLSPLTICASYNDNPQILKLLLSYYSSNEKEVFKSFVIVLTSNSGSEFSTIAKVNAFIESSVPLNSFYEGKTPLMYAASFSKSTKVIKLLLESGAQPQIRSTEGKTAMDYALENKSLAHDDFFWILNIK